VSEGRDPLVLRALAEACGPALLDVHHDPDHHRSVFTLAGPGPQDAEMAVRALADAVADRLDHADHRGVHPNLGALDVVPFVALGDTPAERAVNAAREFARWWSQRRRVPVFCYDAADPQGRSLPETRRDAFAGRRPDLGPDEPHPHLGATAVGARSPLVAVNCRLDCDDIGIARRIARRVRERDGGLPGVRALGLDLATVGRAQVSMNLVDPGRTGIEAACSAVRDRAREEGCGIEAVELVGLVPRSVMRSCSSGFLAWSGLDPQATIEDRLAARDSGRNPAPGPGDRD
jgi:glutamate formiminotransferase